MRRRALLPALAVLVPLVAGCTDSGGAGDGDESADDGTVEVSEVGSAFTFRDLSVAEGWTMRGVERSAGIGESTTSPEIRGTVTNEGDEPAYALFEVVFAEGGEPVSIVKCSSPEVPAGESADLLCPGLGQPMPEGYDQIVVQEITR